MKSSPEVDLNLPEKREVLLFVPLTPMQRFWVSYSPLHVRAGALRMHQSLAAS